MKQYFTNKLKELNRLIKSATNDVVKYAYEGDIKKIQSSLVYLTEKKNRLEEFSRDASKELPINDIIELLKLELLTKRDVAYVLKYDRSVTIQERDILCVISYDFKDIKVK